MMKLGSLFDGSGGFPLAGIMCGITPVWASEIEKFPIQVTSKRFPDMKHLGDIAKINGAEIEPVDIVTFGSPCQGLSVAGLQKGLEDDRSGLFLEAIRIIKEMRAKTDGKYPTFALWENVPGAFSSSKGEDFKTVLEEMCKISSPDVSIPRPPKRKGKNSRLEWRNAGSIMGDGYSIAWRVLNAQFWGVPQRRKRIFLVADFGGQRAGEILFERESLSRYFTQSKNPWQGAASTAKNGIRTSCGFSGNNSITSGGVSLIDERSPTLQVKKDAHVLIYDARGNGNGNICPTITGDHNGQISDYTAICIVGNIINRQDHNGGNGVGCQENVSYTLNTIDRHAVAYGQQSYDKYVENDVSPTLKAKGANYNGGSETLILERQNYNLFVRRLTPTECARLQGFPDWWCIDVPHADSVEYKMWGNGIALPCALYVMEGIVEILNKENIEWE